MNERCLRVPGRQGLCLESWRPRWCSEVGAEEPGWCWGVAVWGWCKGLNLFVGQKGAEQVSSLPFCAVGGREGCASVKGSGSLQLRCSA